jgi:hypothetical protein
MPASIESIDSEGSSVSAGKSSQSKPSRRNTRRAPLRGEWNSIASASVPISPNSTKADASVAWPQRSTSSVGVNQRMAHASPSGTTKAVSERLFSLAMACIRSSGSQCPGRHTAAGFPRNRAPVNASTWKSGMDVLIRRRSFARGGPSGHPGHRGWPSPGNCGGRAAAPAGTRSRG